jgi:carbamoyl-phosphate synthase large subunit
MINAGEIDLVINTPHGSSGAGGSVRVDGYEIRTASVATAPIIATRDAAHPSFRPASNAVR